MARELAYDPDMFDYGKSGLKGADLPKDLGFAGFRVNFHTDLTRDITAFLGASYFRAVGGDWQYGLSARGLAIDTGMERPEEFPMFRDFWIERPARGLQHAGGLRVAGFAQRRRRLSLRDHARRDAPRWTWMPRCTRARPSSAWASRPLHQHVPVRRERPPHGERLASGNP